MKAEIYVVDENGKRVNTKPALLEPVDIRYNGIVTTYTFAFEFSKLDEDAFDKIVEVEE